MKRFILFLIVTAGVLQTSLAQVKWGVKAGLNISTLSFSDSYWEKTSHAGFFIGPEALLPLNGKGLALHAALLYDQRGANIDPVDLDGGRIYDTDITLHQLVLPVSIRIGNSIGSKSQLYFQVGPQLGLCLDQHIITSAYGDWDPATFVLSLNGGIGIVINDHIDVMASYNAPLTKTAEMWINRTARDGGTSISDGSLGAFQLGVSYRF